MAAMTGQCLCGTVTFTADTVETHHHVCHCKMCLRWSGGPLFAANVGSVEFNGADHIKRFESSPWAERGFCDVCGSNLFYRVKNADKYFMAVGTFDDKKSFELNGELYIDLKPDGYAFVGDHERLTEAEVIAKFMPS